MQIESDLYARQLGEKIHNFSKLLPDKQSDLAIQTMKDPYICICWRTIFDKG